MFQQQLVFHIETKGSVKFDSGELGTSSDPLITRRDKHACRKPMLTDPDRHAAGNRLHDTKDRINKEDPMQGIPEWLQPFTENLEDLETHVPAHTSERENSDSECSTKIVEHFKSRKHSIYTYFPKARNCDVCLRTKITRSPCRRRQKGSIPRAEKFCDLITADHKIPNEEGESRNNHRHAVVVQGLATQWIQSYSCGTKTSHETEKSVRKILEPSQKPKVIYTDNSFEFGKLVKNYHGIIGPQHLIEQKRMGLQNELYDQ